MINKIDTHLRLEKKNPAAHCEGGRTACAAQWQRLPLCFLKKSENVLRHCYDARIELTSALDLGFCVNRMQEATLVAFGDDNDLHS